MEKKKLAQAIIAGVAGVAATGPAQAQLGAGAVRPAILEQMSGRWDVEQTMWTGPDAEPMRLPAARAERRVPPGGGYIEEELTLAAPSGEPFTRSARLNYNAVDGRFEYFSLDTRAPQQMSYRSQYADPNFAGLLKFEGGTFVAAQWGEMKNVALAYRVELSAVTEGRQTLRLFLKPLMAGKQREFMAFRYEYRRR